MDKLQTKDESTPVTYDFKCCICGMNEEAHYKGASPTFSRNIELKYPSYIMRDPFSPPGKGEILVLGADCAMCQRTTCIDKQCSIFYVKLYCTECVRTSIDKFPPEITNKITPK